jgi:enoyl-CoA hydratase/carnithine racemase
VLRVERRGTTALWTIARPQAKNALDAATMAELARAAEGAAQDPGLRAIVLTGEGDAFVSGGDLRELAGKHAPADAERFADAGAALCTALAELPFPVLAALPGVAFGGGAELAVACDLRVADRRARVSWKQVRLGVTPAWGVLGRLVSLVGAGTAARLLYTAQELSAGEALAVGLVDAICDDGTCAEVALAWADDIARGSPEAVASMKRLLRARERAGGAELLAGERASFVATWTGPDHIEAVNAYFERRPPAWKTRG